MWWRATQSRSDRAAHCALAKVAFVAVLLVFGLMGSAAEACPDSRQGAGPASVANTIERASPVPIVVVSAAPDQTAAKPNQMGLCCGAGCQVHGAACGIACCPGGLAAIGLLSADLFAPAGSIGLPPFDQAEIVSAQLPPDLKPPRILI